METFFFSVVNDSVHVTNVDQNKVEEQCASWSALFGFQSVHILKCSIYIRNDFMHIERWTSPFNIFSMIMIICKIKTKHF
jgi:hypothetical protein